MNESTHTKPPMWFLIVAVIALIWNLLGLMAFFMQVTMSEEALAALPEAQQELFKIMPSWVNIAFGVAVVAGVAGCVLLLIRKKLALPVFGLSLLGILAQNTYMFFLSDTFTVMGSSAMVFPICVIMIAIGLIVLTNIANKNGWLG